MTVENCLRLAQICRDHDDEAGAKMYEARAQRKEGKRERLIAIEIASIKQLEANEEARLQKLEKDLGIETKSSVPGTAPAQLKSKEKPKEENEPGFTKEAIKGARKIKDMEKKDGKTTKGSGN